MSLYLCTSPAGGTDVASVDSQTMENLVSWLLERAELQIVESESESSDSSLEEGVDDTDSSESTGSEDEEDEEEGEEGAFGEVST